jgi:uncharacterized protein YfbU (UPF0304 family)
MKALQLILLSLIFVSKSDGQTVDKNYVGKIDVEIIKEKKPRRIYAKVEISLAFPGGDSAWIQTIEKRINQSIGFRNGAKKGKYIASVKFIVGKDGRFFEVMCDKDPGFGMCEEIIKAVKNSYSDKWFPAKQPIDVKVKSDTNQ